MNDDREIYCPSIDVCAYCSDSECGGTCFYELDPDDPDDVEAVEQLHAWIRRGRLLEQIERALADAENRPHPLPWNTK